MSAYTLAQSAARRTVLLAVLVLGLAMLLLTACGGDDEEPVAAGSGTGTEQASSDGGSGGDGKCEKMDTLVTGASPALAYAPPQIAETEGILAKYCIKLKTESIAGAAALLAQVQSGRAQLGLLNPAGIVQAVQSGIKLRIIAPNTEPGDFALVAAKKNDQINELKDFEGKTLATSLLGANTDIAIRVILEKAGVKNVKFVQVTSANIPQAIINGQVDGGQGNEPSLTQFKDQYKVIHENPMVEAFGQGSPVTYAYVTEKFYNENKDLVTRYQKAYLEVAKMIQADETPFRKAAVDFAKLPKNVADTMRLPTLGTDYRFEALMTQINALAKYKSLKQAPSEEEMRALFVPLPGTDGV